VMVFFKIASHELISQGWFPTKILLISGSWVPTGIQPTLSTFTHSFKYCFMLIVPSPDPLLSFRLYISLSLRRCIWMFNTLLQLNVSKT
jgi:hypothetical protein